MMPKISLSEVLIVAAVALAIPFLLGLAPALRPAVVLEIVAGVAIRPSCFSWKSTCRCKFWTFWGSRSCCFGGLEVDLARLRGGPPRVAALCITERILSGNQPSP
jgi:hypothetical protein